MDNKLNQLILDTAGMAEKALRDHSVCGETITVDGVCVVPVYKLSYGFAGAGIEHAESDTTPLTGGAGAGVTKTPVCYMVFENGRVSFHPTKADGSKPLAGLTGFVGSMVKKKKDQKNA